MHSVGLRLFFLLYMVFLVNMVLVFGPASAALNFNNGNYVRVEDSSSLDITGQITLEAWIYKTWNGEDWNIIFSKPWDYDGHPWHVYRLGITYVGDQPKYATCSIALVGGYAGVGGTSVIPDNTWVHLACTYDGAEAKMYVNGVLEGTTPVSGTIATNDQPVVIGRNLLNSWNDWFGTIDEVRIWNVARTGPQIQESMNRRLTGTEPGLAGYWKFGEGAGTTTADASGNGNTGTLVGNPSWVSGGPLCTPPPSGLVSWWGGDNNALDIVGANDGSLLGGATYAAGKVGQAFSFDGDGDYVSINNTSSMDFGTGDFTVGLWVKLNSLVNDQVFIQKYVGDLYNPQNGKSYLMQFVPPNSLRFLVFDSINNYNDIIVSVSPSLNTGQWYHVAGVRSGNNSKLYLDGSLIADQDAGNNMDTGTGGTAYLGNMVPIISGDTRFLNGYLDEVELFSRALATEEITAIYNAGSAGKCRSCSPPPSGLISWWGGNNNALDMVGTNNGILLNGASYAAGRVGQAFSFTVDGAIVTIPHHPALLLDGNPAATFDGWFRSTGGDSMVIGKHSAGIGWFFTTGQGCYFGDHHIGGFGAGGLNLNDGLFHHFACVKDGTTYREYIDGLLLAEDTGPAVGTLDYGSVEIGRYEFGAQLTGVVDELEVFHRALTTAEIQAIYNAGSAGKCAPDVTPDPLPFQDQTGVEPNALVESNAVSVLGIDYAAPITIAGGLYKISTDGGTVFSDCSMTTPSTVSLNDRVKVCLTSASSFSSPATATLTIGTASGTFTVTTRAQSADLSISKTSAPNPPVLGQKLTYTLTVTNGGPDTAEGVTVTDVLAAALTFDSAVGCNYNNGNRMVSCDLGIIANGAQKSVEIEVIPTTAGSVSNTADVTSGVSDPAPGNDSYVRDVTVEVHLYLPLIIKSP